jgi:FixJ family two-component response regulator
MTTDGCAILLRDFSSRLDFGLKVSRRQRTTWTPAITRVLLSISGFDLDRALAAQHNRVPVVFVSTRNEQEARQEAAQAGAIGFLSKPFDDNSLFYAVHKALRSAKRRA